MTLGPGLHNFSNWSYNTIQAFGYPGLFVVNLAAASTIFFPLPAYIFTFIFAAVLNPFLIAVVCSAGGSLGELVSYGVGRGGRYIVKNKQSKYFEKGMEWFHKGRGFLAIIIFAATPLPFDAIGILAGAMRYSVKKYLLAAFLGKMVMNLVLALSGYYGITWFLHFLNFHF